MKLPSLTVFVPNYNHGKHLAACVESVMTQSVPPTEVILFDDGSTDDSVAVMHALAKRHPIIRVVQSDRNRGVSYGNNQGLELGIGDYFLSLGADDTLLPGLFEKTLPLLAKHPQAAFCGGITRFKDMDTGLEYLYGSKVANRPCYLSPEEMVRLARKDRMLIFTTPMLVNRRQLIANGKFIPEIKWHSDWFAYYVAGYQTGVCYVPEILGEFLKYSTSYSGRGMQDSAQRFRIYREMLDRLSQPQFHTAAARIREGAALALFGKEMLWLVLRHRQYRHFLTPTFVKLALWWTVRAETKKVLPPSLCRLYFRLAGYTQPPPRPASNAP